MYGIVSKPLESAFMAAFRAVVSVVDELAGGAERCPLGFGAGVTDGRLATVGGEDDIVQR
jgi:hypothetical protein